MPEMRAIENGIVHIARKYNSQTKMGVFQNNGFRNATRNQSYVKFLSARVSAGTCLGSHVGRAAVFADVPDGARRGRGVEHATISLWCVVPK